MRAPKKAKANDGAVGTGVAPVPTAAAPVPTAAAPVPTTALRVASMDGSTRVVPTELHAWVRDFKRAVGQVKLIPNCLEGV